MSDFLGELREELLDGLERYERPAPARRLAAGLAPRLRPATLVGAVGLAVLVAAIVVAARTLAPKPPPVRPQVVAVLRIGGTPMDAVSADGSLWATDFDGSLVEVDPREHEVLTRIDVPRSPVPLTSAGGSLWLQTSGRDCRGNLLRIDPTRDRIVRRVPWPYPNEQPGALADGGAGGVWVKEGCAFRQAADRLDRSGTVTARVPLATVDGMAAASGNLWVIGHDGTLTQIDAGNGRVRRRWPGLAPLSLSDSTSWNTHALVADGTGVWVISTRRGAIFHLDRGRIVQRIAIGPDTRPLLAKAPDGLWLTTADRLSSHDRLIRVDPLTGRETASVQLGARRPATLVAAGDQLCVPTDDGSVIFVRPT